MPVVIEIKCPECQSDDVMKLHPEDDRSLIYQCNNDPCNLETFSLKLSTTKLQNEDQPARSSVGGR